VQVQAQARREEQAAKEGRKLSKHEKKVSTSALNTGWRNMESSLCNFFTFWQILGGTHVTPNLSVMYISCVSHSLSLSHVLTGSKPSADLVLDHQKIEAWTEWLPCYYPCGNTVCNKCQHVSSFLTFLETVEGFGDDARIRCKIDHCCSVTNSTAQDGKIVGIQQRATLENDESLLSKGTTSTSSHMHVTIL
jgi:hypothetical protein